MIESHTYRLYLNTPETGFIHCAELMIKEEGIRLRGAALKYTETYLDHPQAFALDPRLFPLQSEQHIIPEARSAPGFLDDYLPDTWGRKVLTGIYSRRREQPFNANKLSDVLAVLGPSRIGALRVVPEGEEAVYSGGAGSESLQRIELAAQLVDAGDFNRLSLDEMSLIYLDRNGTGVGGARPKALINVNGKEYLAKFNRRVDTFNMARVELACLLMANDLRVSPTRACVQTGINDREVLLQERFDVAGDARRHLITVNALRKEWETQEDSGLRFTYDDIAGLLQRYSVQIQQDLETLVTLMLFNRAIHNTDDHERNFSLWHNGHGYVLAPAYDLAPVPDSGDYHAAEFEYHTAPPRPSELAKQPRKVFGLPKPKVKAIAENVIQVVSQWRSYCEKAGVPEAECEALHKVFCL